MYILASYLSTNYNSLIDHWKKYSILKQQGKSGSDRPFTGELGGKLELIRWEDKSVVWQMDMESPSGIFQESSNLIYVNSLKLGQVFVISVSEKNIIGIINNPYFNKPHTITKTKKGFLVSSTGLDAIVEVSKRGDNLFSLFLTEHGYTLDQFGRERIIDKKINHQGIEYPSLHQTTHVNYARYIDKAETKIAATLFHHGELVVFDKVSQLIEKKLTNLKNPHNLKPAGDRFILCNTTANEVCILNSSFSIVQTIGNKAGLSWVQDAIWIPQTNRMLIADADNHRIVEFDHLNNIRDEYFFSRDYRIFEVYLFNK